MIRRFWSNDMNQDVVLACRSQQATEGRSGWASFALSGVVHFRIRSLVLQHRLYHDFIFWRVFLCAQENKNHCCLLQLLNVWPVGHDGTESTMDQKTKDTFRTNHHSQTKNYSVPVSVRKECRYWLYILQGKSFKSTCLTILKNKNSLSLSARYI